MLAASPILLLNSRTYHQHGMECVVQNGALFIEIESVNWCSIAGPVVDLSVTGDAAYRATFCGVRSNSGRGRCGAGRGLCLGVSA